MGTFLGEVRDGFGRAVGAGLVLDGEGELAEILPRGYAGTGDVEGATILPGLVDVHCHGGGGASFSDDLEPAAIETAIRAHRSVGTTALLASLVSMADPLPAIEALVPFCESGQLAGIHLEGPYICPHRAGAQNPAAIRDADPDELRGWLLAGAGWIKTMTIAPEAGGAIEAARTLVDFGAKPSWGHTDADGRTAAEAIASTLDHARAIGFDGAPQTATHLFNAMPPLGHRDPGPVREFVRAALRGELVVETVGDGVHLSPLLVEDIHRWIGRDNPLGAAFVTDAMAAAGMPAGRYRLGGVEVDVAGGTARLAGKDAIAGGCSRMVEQFGLFVRRGVLTPEEVVRGMVASPVAAASLHGSRGVTLSFEAGVAPNFVVLDAEHLPLAVVREGTRLR